VKKMKNERIKNGINNNINHRLQQVLKGRFPPFGQGAWISGFQP